MSNNQDVSPNDVSVVVSPDEELYLKGILEKFNSDQNNQALSDSERSLLSKMSEVQKTINEKSKKVNEMYQELQTFQQQITLLNGQSQGLLSALLALKPQ